MFSFFDNVKLGLGFAIAIQILTQFATLKITLYLQLALFSYCLQESVFYTTKSTECEYSLGYESETDLDANSPISQLIQLLNQYTDHVLHLKITKPKAVNVAATSLMSQCKDVVGTFAKRSIESCR